MKDLISKEEMTVKKFMLKKFPTNEYMDCPVPRHHWDTIQEYAEIYHESKLQPLFEAKDKDLKLFARSITALNNEIGVMEKEIDELKTKLKDKLPYECVFSYGEVKFCHIRNGDGNQCKQCCNY